MSIESSCVQAASLRLHAYLCQKHWTGQALSGPDPVGKIQWRITRFVRSYLPALPNDDQFIYLQGQAYWIRSNLLLRELTGDDRYLDDVVACADAMVARQPANGAWVHPPVRERRGFISTVEGVWGSLGLTAAYRATGTCAYLEAAQRWYEFQIQGVGFQMVGEGLAPNYYTHSTIAVPNVTTMLIWLTHELAQLTGDQRYLEYTERMLTFVEQSQLPSGELPYIHLTRPHFMCFQYNSYQLLDLIHAYELRPSERLYALLQKLALFVSTGVLPNGSCRYDCFKATPEVNYWNAAIGDALRRAHKLGLGDYLPLSERAYDRVLTQQRSDGSFLFSRYNYRFLSDRRSYPRYLAMILHHLLSRVEQRPSSSPAVGLAAKVSEPRNLALA
jgi:hypothetical protein